MPVVLRAALAVIALALVLPGGAFAATSAGQPFPSNIYTTPDATQLTGLRIALPTAGCTPSDCADLAVLNTLDGFNIQPRISIPFSGPIDPATVSSSTVFLVGPNGHIVGINQRVWEPAKNTLHVESDEQLSQDTTYLLVVTRGVHDSAGHPLAALPLAELMASEPKGYLKDLLEEMPAAFAAGIEPADVAAASVFTTQSINAISTRIRSQLRRSEVNFALGMNGERTVFQLSPGMSVALTRQTGTATFVTSSFFLPILNGYVDTLAFGSYASPNYENGDEIIPTVGTRTGHPAIQSTNQLGFTLFVPAGDEPKHGWPVAIFGHGFTDSKDGAPWAVAGTLAQNGVATVAINVVGHGFGPLGTYTVSRPGSASVTLPSGGRAVDQNHDGKFESTEGVSAVGAQSLIGNRDGLRQTAIDLMQLVRVLRGGVDVDGDGKTDLSRQRIYYAGQSFGGIYGVQLLGLEPDIRAGVPNVPGGSIIEVARLGAFRPLVGLALLFRVPSLYNAVPNPPLFTSFNENIPLRNLPLVVDTVPGASAIQTVIDNTEWVQQAANPAAYAPFISQPVIIQFARGDQTVPNPTTSAIIRAGGLAGRATLFRNDLAVAANNAVPHNPHTFLTNLFNAGALYAAEAQQQIATFFATDGAVTIDPDGGGTAGRFFETPTSMVPEDLAFIP
jgi:Bacterial Ig-like domain